MPKDYPRYISLKKRKCPACGEDFGHPDLRASESAVQAACRNGKCDFNLELFWLGDTQSWSN